MYCYFYYRIGILTKSTAYAVNQQPQAEPWESDTGWGQVRANIPDPHQYQYRSDGSVISSARSGEHDVDGEWVDRGDFHGFHAQPNSPIDASPVNLFSPQPLPPNDPPSAAAQPTDHHHRPPSPSPVPVPNVLPGYLSTASSRVVDAARSFFPWLFVASLFWQAVALSPCRIQYRLILPKCSQYYLVYAIAFVCVIGCFIFFDHSLAGIAPARTGLGSYVDSYRSNIGVSPCIRYRL